MKIISGIEDIINQLKENISQFIVIGELCKSNYVKNRLINNNRIQFLDNYENLVMKGAALYGLKKIMDIFKYFFIICY